MITNYSRDLLGIKGTYGKMVQYDRPLLFLILIPIYQSFGMLV